MRLSPKSGEVHGLEMVAYTVAQGSERPVHVLGIVRRLLGLKEALTAELFLEKGAVLVKSPLDPGDTASFAHPQLLAHQPDEALIVGHQNHATPKIVESTAQSLNRLHIQVVCGFIQNVEVGAGHGHLSKSYPALLAPRQAGNGAHSQFSRDAIPAQLVTILLLRPSRKLACQQFHSTDIQVQLLHVVLAEVANLQIPVSMSDAPNRC